MSKSQKQQNTATIPTSIFQVHSFVCQLDYVVPRWEWWHGFVALRTNSSNLKFVYQHQLQQTRIADLAALCVYEETLLKQKQNDTQTQCICVICVCLLNVNHAQSFLICTCEKMSWCGCIVFYNIIELFKCDHGVFPFDHLISSPYEPELAMSIFAYDTFGTETTYFCMLVLCQI